MNTELKILVNLILGFALAMLFFLWTFEPNEFMQYAGLVVGLGVAFTIGKLNTDEIDKLKNEIDKLKKNNSQNI